MKLDDLSFDTRDIPEISNRENAERKRFYRSARRQTTLRINAGMLTWFQDRSRKFQNRINTAMHEYIGRRRKTG